MITQEGRDDLNLKQFSIQEQTSSVFPVKSVVTSGNNLNGSPRTSTYEEPVVQLVSDLNDESALYKIARATIAPENSQIPISQSQHTSTVKV